MGSARIKWVWYSMEFGYSKSLNSIRLAQCSSIGTWEDTWKTSSKPCLNLQSNTCDLNFTSFWFFYLALTKVSVISWLALAVKSWLVWTEVEHRWLILAACWLEPDSCSNDCNISAFQLCNTFTWNAKTSCNFSILKISLQPCIILCQIFKT